MKNIWANILLFFHMRDGRRVEFDQFSFKQLWHGIIFIFNHFQRLRSKFTRSKMTLGFEYWIVSVIKIFNENWKRNKCGSRGTCNCEFGASSILAQCCSLYQLQLWCQFFRLLQLDWPTTQASFKFIWEITVKILLLRFCNRMDWELVWSFRSKEQSMVQYKSQALHTIIVMLVSHKLWLILHHRFFWSEGPNWFQTILD